MLTILILILASLFHTDACLNATKMLCPRKSRLQELFDICDVFVGQREYASTIQRLNPNATFLHHVKKPLLDHGETFTWQRVAQRKVYVYSAFLETRAEADGPAIRIIATGWQAAYNTIGDMYCQLWYDSFDYAIVVGPAIYNVIYPSTLHHKDWSSHFILCKLPKGVIELPYAVSIIATRNMTSENRLLVQNREPVVKGNTHALCISAVYNLFDEWRMIVEFFELQKILGVSEITIYEYSTSIETSVLLHSYARTENVNVHQWPIPDHMVGKSNVFCQRAAINDCLYRMGHRHRYVIVTDLDEIIVPRSHDTLPELTRAMRRLDVGAYLFQHAYFRRNSTKKQPVLITQISLWRTDEVTPPGRIRCKAMYVADLAVSIDLHYAYEMLPGTKWQILEPNVGMLHHYRNTPMEMFRKHPEKYTFIKDRYMHRYRTQLVAAYNSKLASAPDLTRLL